MLKIKTFLKGILFMACLMVIFMVGISGDIPDKAEAATQNYSEVVTGVQVVSLPIMGIYTATRTGIITFQIPFKAKVLGVSAKARASSGTTPTLSVDVKEGGVSILSAPFFLNSSSVVEGTISDKTLADESTISVDLAIGGDTPVWEDITTILTLRRTN